MFDPRPTAPPQRELWLTPMALRFLKQGGKTERMERLTDDIVRALDGRNKNSGRVRLTAIAFLMYILDPEVPGGRERVLVWHGPSDGSFYDDAILEKASLHGVDFV